MLLIGSRAIRYHLPEFRSPRDWDIVATGEELSQLRCLLEPVGPQGDDHPKVFFRFEGALVEVTNSDHLPYWANVRELFANQPTLEVPGMGSLHLAPVEYLMLTKHCGLIYRILHWHKNLEDLYYLRDRIRAIPNSISCLLAECLADARRMYGARHAADLNSVPVCCPGLPPVPDPGLHRALHDCLALDGKAAVHQASAWQGFTELPPGQRRASMIRLLAEEAMVLAAERIVTHVNDGRSESEWLRFALRELMVGRLSESWRYFGVNHYREIRAAIPPDWCVKFHGATLPVPIFDRDCQGGDPGCSGSLSRP